MKNQIVTIAINGDSGDGIQLLGQLFSRDISKNSIFIKTEPNFPAEIRAPQGTVAGLSGFKISIGEQSHFAIEKNLDVLVALNPAGIAKLLPQLRTNALLIINSDQMTPKDFDKAQLEHDYFDKIKSNQDFILLEVPITSLTLQALKDADLPHSKLKQCKNMYLLGLLLYLFERDYEYVTHWLKAKLQNKLDMYEANILALKAGYLYYDVQEFQLPKFKTQHDQLKSGKYRQLNGNQALALGAVVTAKQLGRKLVFSGYPITPASTMLHELQNYKDSNINVVQAEDEIAACGIALGGSYGGALGLTCTSGPGLDLKMEMIGLAAMVELPLVIIDVQRAGPSTGLPTCTEQSDLLQAIYGRHGESHCVVIAAHSAVNCFKAIRKAFEIALNFSVPVFLLSDASIANSIEVWQIPENLSELNVPTLSTSLDKPYQRNPETKARVLFELGHSANIQTMGGLEKDPDTGHVSYTPHAHQAMSELRRDKMHALSENSDDFVYLGVKKPDLLIVTWGSSFVACDALYHELLESNLKLGLLRIDMLFPLPTKIESYLKSATKVCVVEQNEGQLCQLIRARFLVDAISVNKLAGESFQREELIEKISQLIDLKEQDYA